MEHESQFSLAFLKMGIWEWGLVALYALVALILLIRHRRDFRFTRRRLFLFLGLVAASVVVNHVLVFKPAAPDLPPPPNVPASPVELRLLLLGSLPVFAAGAWLGVGPALLVGLVGGIVRTDVWLSGIATPFYLAFFGWLLAYHLRQDCAGALAAVARQPLAATLVALPLARVAMLFAIFVHVANAGLSGFDYAVTLTRASLYPMLVESLTAAAVVQALYLFPQLRPVRVARRPPPYNRSLNHRALFIFLPLTIIVTCALIYVATSTTLRMVTLEMINEMVRDSNVAADSVSDFLSTGQGLLTGFSRNERLWEGDSDVLETTLATDVQSAIFFDQLMLLDLGGNPLAMYPPAPLGDPRLTLQESVLLPRVAREGVPQTTSPHFSGQGVPVLSFLTPVERVGDDGNQVRLGVLVGRVRLDINPWVARMLTALQWVGGEGDGFIVDQARWQIVAHPNVEMLLARWRPEEERPAIARGPRGWAYESRDPVRNTRQLVYYAPIEGCSWAVVIRLPYEVVLKRAYDVAAPLLLLLSIFGVGVLIAIPMATGLLTCPLQQLVAAADRIAAGDLGQPIQARATEEIKRLTEAFEDMRVRLKDRMEELTLLLEVSQAISATLDLSTGIPRVLEGVLRATDARVARVVLLSNTGQVQTVVSKGSPDEGLETLDSVVVSTVVDRKSSLVLENLARVKALSAASSVNGAIKALVALPIYARGQISAVLWVGYDRVRYFENPDIDLLFTLAGQIAVLMENARLFRTAEGGRRQLAAILDSTTDAVLVTDHEERILLVNPAAERAFAIAAEAVAGQKIAQAGLSPELVRAFARLSAADRALTEEIPLADGRMLHASLSMIQGADGEYLGRVAVLRDITHFKELDEMKSEFLATVSHDLRAPLTFMRGYANMLLTMNDLGEKQREYVEKILYGVEQINELVSTLLDLGRIQTGVGFEHKPCHLVGVLIEAVDSMRARAVAKGITVRLEPSENRTVVYGDATLLRQAVTNLLDNAIKYTPTGGIVTVGLSLRTDGEGACAVIRVSDTGIGIAPEDQVRLFERFYRIKRPDAPDAAGTGLGLALVKSIVERHGGKVWVDSELYEGSTFYISLPLSGESCL